MNEQVQILCVDDERNVLKAMERIFLDDDFEIITAESAEEGLVALAENPGVRLVISDYRMPGMNGVDFLKGVFGQRPDTVRIVLSGYADTAAVVAAINEGQIYKFIPKPWNDDELRQTVIKALEAFELRQRNQELAQELFQANVKMHESNLQLERIVTERTGDLILQNRALYHSQNILYHLPVGVISIVADGVVAQCNKEAEKILGVASGTLLTEKSADVLPAGLQEIYRAVAVSGSAVCLQLHCGDKAVLVRAVRMEESDQEAIIMVMTDLGSSAKEACHV
jgi:response regulator RpfG family c-di-GMP phosphodiesterase